MSLWKHIESDIAATLGGDVRLSAPDSVGGGCINQAVRVASAQGHFFIKLNSASRLDMFEAEAEGLRELMRCDALRIPRPVCCGVSDGQAYLVMEALELGGPGDQVALGEGLAALHAISAEQFGWHRDNTIGDTPQPNRQHPDWAAFWREQRLGFQLQLAARKGAASRTLDAGQRLLGELEQLLDGHAPLPSLLHGDLWSGNYSFTAAGEPAIFDPAVYYGDREADLAMTELFGGFSRSFYAAYQNAWPLDAGYPLRKKLYNLYHVLNHYNMFGGGYLAQAQGLIDALSSETR
jgi:fructosamine-3-kinase